MDLKNKFVLFRVLVCRLILHVDIKVLMMESSRTKSVCVKYISDSDVGTIFSALDIEKARGSQILKDDDSVPSEAVQNKPSSLFESGDIAGKLIFGFQTPKRHGAMASKASECTSKTPQTPIHEKEEKAQPTPLSRGCRSRSKKHVEMSQLPHNISLLVTTPVTSSPSQQKLSQKNNANRTAKKLCYSIEETEKENRVCPQTPYNLRKRMKKKLATISSEELCYSDESGVDFSGSESDWDDKSDVSSADSGSENEENNVVQKVIFSKKSNDFGPSFSKKLKLSFVPAVEEYFQSHASKRIHTSNHTLGKLRHNLPQEKLQMLLKETKSLHCKQLKILSSNVMCLFSKWHFMLREGFNILLYGVGSKQSLLSAFHQQITEPSVVVNGFFPSLTVQEIVSSIAEDILGLKGVSVDLLETVDCIRKAFSQYHNEHLFLIIHNIDGVMLRNDKIQEVLAYLSSTHNIHVIASIDHICAPLMWDQNMLSMFNFSWWDATSFQPYVNETAFESSLLVQQSGNLALSSLQNVFRSLTKNAKSIFLLMAEYQKEHKDETNYSGMPFKKLYCLCRESLLVSSDLALRSQLTEFLDHRLVKSRRGHDGSELLTIPMDMAILDQFVTEQTIL